MRMGLLIVLDTKKAHKSKQEQHGRAKWKKFIAWIVMAKNLADRTILWGIAWILGLLLLDQLLGAASAICKAMSSAARWQTGTQKHVALSNNCWCCIVWLITNSWREEGCMLEWSITGHANIHHTPPFFPISGEVAETFSSLVLWHLEAQLFRMSLRCC